MMQSPFFTTQNYEGLTIHIKINSLLLITGVAQLFVLAVSVLTSCALKFDCSEFLPTISYLASYPYYDRFVTFAISISILPLVLFFTSAYAEYKLHMSNIDSKTLLSLSMFLCLLLPFLSIVDEVSTSVYVPLDKLHVIILSFSISFLLIWILFSFEWLYKSFKKTQDPKILLVSGYIVICLCSLLTTYHYWKVSDSALTYQTLALCEYSTIALFTFLPFAYCFLLNDLKIFLHRGKVPQVKN